MHSLQLLPIGQQDFSELRRTNRLYVDKTNYIYNMLHHGSVFFFLARPRRFGKSLLVSTLKCIFEGKKELFEGLYIYDKISWDAHPIIHLDFSNLDFKGKGLRTALSDRLDEIAAAYIVPPLKRLRLAVSLRS